VLDNLANINGLPQYIRIRESIRERILSGELVRGEKLPSEDELAMVYGVSRMTLRQSLADLIDEGLLYRKHGVGTFVALQQFARDHTVLRNFIETSKEEGLNVEEKLLDARLTSAKFQVARALNLEEGDKVVCLKTLRILEGNPITIHEAYFDHVKFSDFLEGNIEELSKDLLAYYESKGYKVKRGIQRLEARSIENDIAEILQIDESTPLLYKERTLYTAEGIPVEFLYCYNRGDLYSVTINLTT
jgi:GntR family transcriptional regulator